MMRLLRGVSGAVALGVALTACVTEPSADGGARAGGGQAQAGARSSAVPSTPSSTPSTAVSTPPRTRPAEVPAAEISATRTERLASDGRPRAARLSVPAIGLHRLRVVPYRGRPDDGPGTRIQNGGLAASPYGPRGGTGAGGIGNYIVTAHRTSSTRAFAELPSLRQGDRVLVVADDTRYVYRVLRTRWTSFRSPESLRAQAAPVPGHPGRRPQHAMITLSTCATQEDHARGNYWSDRFGNPEHRIDKIGVLVSVRPA